MIHDLGVIAEGVMLAIWACAIACAAVDYLPGFLRRKK